MDKPVIELKDVTKEYEIKKDKVTKALQGVNLTVNQGEFVAIMGPSGSGKSTLLHILGLLDRRLGGSYYLNGQDVKSLSANKLADLRGEEIGFVFQRFNLLKRTSVIDNVLLPTVYLKKKDDTKRAWQLMDKLGIKDLVDNKSNEISGGEVQRVAIARGLIMQPSLLLADEPTGNIDTKTAKQIMDILKQINQEGTTILLITHEAEIAQHADRIVRMRDGKFEQGDKS